MQNFVHCANEHYMNEANLSIKSPTDDDISEEDDQKSNSTTETKWSHTDHKGGKRFPTSEKANTRIKKHILEMAINMTC